MIIKASKQLPSIEELLQFLKRELPSSYSFKLKGFGKKSILIGKSTLVGAEVSINKNEVMVNYSPPSTFAGIVSGLAMTELAVVIFPFFLAESRNSKGNFEKEVGRLISDSFN